jgi:threonylcarbamoyladenosine tRNA methylthiotransferase MtaB
MPRVALHTLGCKLNYAETATIGKQFLRRGYELARAGEPADVWVINTCSVTERANRECRQLIRRALRSPGNPYVIVTGCYAQLDPEKVASIKGVDVVLGTKEKFDLFRYADPLSGKGGPRVHVSEIDAADTFGPAFTTEAGSRTRAYLKVQDGCDFNCSFCTIPLARGVSRSQPVNDAVAQARDLVGQGYREIVLTGVNVGDYGKNSGASLLTLLRALDQVDGLERLRVSSIEPNLLTSGIIEAVAGSRTLCPHFHVPLQSGTDEILHAMRRRYTAGQYADLIHAIRQRIPDAAIGVDVITGFPGESDAHFETTYRYLSGLPVSYLHVFTYSERPNTPAATMNGAVEPRVRYQRNDMLRMLGQKKKRAFYESRLGRVVTVLTEGDVEQGVRFGFTPNYVRVGIPEKVCNENEIVRTRITGVSATACIGVVEEEGATG